MEKTWLYRCDFNTDEDYFKYLESLKPDKIKEHPIYLTDDMITENEMDAKNWKDIEVSSKQQQYFEDNMVSDFGESIELFKETLYSSKFKKELTKADSVVQKIYKLCKLTPDEILAFELSIFFGYREVSELLEISKSKVERLIASSNEKLEAFRRLKNTRIV